jgi:hypothetical protein
VEHARVKARAAAVLRKLDKMSAELQVRDVVNTSLSSSTEVLMPVCCQLALSARGDHVCD